MKPADLVMQSYGRCCRAEDFFDTFYRFFLASSPDVRAKFANTNMQAQKLLLRQGIMNIVLYARGMPDTKLKALGCSHSRKAMNIRPELYAFWTDALLKTIREHDAEADSTTLNAWTEIINQGIAVILKEY